MNEWSFFLKNEQDGSYILKREKNSKFQSILMYVSIKKRVNSLILFLKLWLINLKGVNDFKAELEKGTIESRVSIQLFHGTWRHFLKQRHRLRPIF